MVQTLRIALVAASLAVVGVVVAVNPSAAIAHDGIEHTTDTEATSHERQEAAKQRMAGKLDEARKKVCQNRVSNIKKIMSNAGEAAQRQQAVFGKIAERVQQFYATKKLNVANYTQLVDAVNTKKEAVTAALAAVRALPQFDCSADNPVGAVDQYKVKLQGVRNALKDYRSAVHALLVAVKTAAKAAEGTQ
ncbi:MAG TPA: hypothetical protein VLA88_00675 [Candidatus Saccharimonadales bacterium]|nr:hypothetical protein [Candidatus Saccharimonadales bacterium]